MVHANLVISIQRRPRGAGLAKIAHALQDIQQLGRRHARRASRILTKIKQGQQRACHVQADLALLLGVCHVNVKTVLKGRMPWTIGKDVLSEFSLTWILRARASGISYSNLHSSHKTRIHVQAHTHTHTLRLVI